MRVYMVFVIVSIAIGYSDNSVFEPISTPICRQPLLASYQY